MGVGARGPHKKLVDAAVHWVGSDSPKPKPKPLAEDDDYAAALRRVGVKQADIEAAQQEQADAQDEEQQSEPEFEVYEDCWDSVMFFLRVQTQWLFRGFEGQRGGLNNTAVESTMRMAGVEQGAQDALLEDLQVMEMAILRCDAERAAKVA